MKEKSEILAHHQNFTTFIHGLNSMDETLLRKPIAEGKWSIIEIVGHFYPWDEFVLQQRLPFLFTGEFLPKAPSADELNRLSSFIARRESIENTLNKCIAVRQDFINQLLQVSEEKWLKSNTDRPVYFNVLRVFKRFNGT